MVSSAKYQRLGQYIYNKITRLFEPQFVGVLDNKVAVVDKLYELKDDDMLDIIMEWIDENVEGGAEGLVKR